jgi:undecaprenyl-diphosphatase
LTLVHVHIDPPLTPASFLLPRRRLLLTLGVVLLALALAAALANGQVLLTWDEPIQRTVEAHRTAALDSFFLGISRLGSTIPVLVLGTVLTLVTWRRCSAVAVAVAAATLSRPLLEFTIKASVDRSRPDLQRLVAGNGPSFPSGHVMASVALWGLLPVIVGLYTKRRDIWWASVVVAGTLIGGISASRVYLGVHWFSDVVGGLLVGTFFLVGVDTVFKRTHCRYPCRVGCDDDADAWMADAPTLTAASATPTVDAATEPAPVAAVEPALAMNSAAVETDLGDVRP